MMRFLLCLLGLCLPGLARADILPRAAPPPAVATYPHDRLSRIVAVHRLQCGVITAAEDYSMASTHGDLAAFGGDLCRAVGAALLGDTDDVVVSAFPDDQHALRAVQAGTIDLLFAVTPDAASALPYSVAFGPTALFDAQGMMVARRSGITRPEQLANKPLCFITGTSQEARMNDWAAATGTKFYAHDFQERGEMDAALVTGSCAAITDDVTALAEVRAKFHARADDFVILPQMIAIDAWAPAMRAGEVRLNAVVTDVLAALITGEERNTTAANPQTAATPGIKATLMMPDGWAERAIGAEGNYGQIYDKTLGKLNLPRGADALWTHGGMLASPGMR